MSGDGIVQSASFSEAGFTLTGYSGTLIASAGQDSFVCADSAGFWLNGKLGGVILEKDDGGTFDLTSIDQSFLNPGTAVGNLTLTLITAVHLTPTVTGVAVISALGLWAASGVLVDRRNLRRIND